MSKELIILYNSLIKTLLLPIPNLLLVAVVLFFDYRHRSLYASKVTKPRSTPSNVNVQKSQYFQQS